MSNIRWRDTFDISSIHNATVLSDTMFKLSPDREFVIALSVNTIIMLAEFWFFLVNMIRISDKIKEFTRDNDQQFEPLSENDVFGIPSPLTIIKQFFESVEKENDEKNNKNNDDEENERAEEEEEKRPKFGAKTASHMTSLSKKDTSLQHRRKKHKKDLEHGTTTNNNNNNQDEHILLDEFGNDTATHRYGKHCFGHLVAWCKQTCLRTTHKHGGGGSSKSGGCRRLCLFCRAKCDRSSFNMKSKCKSILYWCLKSVQSVFIFTKDGLYHLFILKQEENIVVDDHDRRRRRPQRKRNNQGKEKTKSQHYHVQRSPTVHPHHSNTYYTEADNTF
jgi:hypothetical protein